MMGDATLQLQRRLLCQIMRDDFHAFLMGAFKEMHGEEMNENWHHEVICDALLSCHEGDDKRLIINVPPRSLKSFICNVAWPAWLMGQKPSIQIISVSYAQDLSNKFARDQRALMQSDFYRRIFPKTKLNPRKQSESDFETTARGSRVSTSTGGILTGRGADVIIIDDPIKPQDAFSETQRNKAIDWIESTLMTRLNDKKHGKMVLIMQRVHEDDPSGHLLEKGGWRHSVFPAIAIEDESWVLSDGSVKTRACGELLHPSHEPKHVLEQLKHDQGGMHFNAQYQQNPAPADGNIIKEKYFQYADPPASRNGAYHYISIDAAMKEGDGNDYSAITIWQKRDSLYYLVDVIRDRMEFPKLMHCVEDLRKRYAPARLLIEDASSGTPLQQLLRSHGIYPELCKPAGSKIERLSAASIAFEQGRVFFPTNDPHWLAGYKRELLGFPNSKHDDQVDSTSQFLNWALTKGSQKAQIVRLTGL